jgi:O-antigen/teichoic acid export membrane protein
MATLGIASNALGILLNSLSLFALAAPSSSQLVKTLIVIAVFVGTPLSILGVISSSLLIAERLVGLYLSIAVISANIILVLIFAFLQLGGASNAADIGSGILYIFSFFIDTAILFYWLRPNHRWYLNSTRVNQT